MPKTLFSAGVLASFTLAIQSAQGSELTFPIRDAGARMERVGADVYSIIHDDATEEWPHGNTGVVVGDDAVLVIDAGYLPSRARSDIALIKTVTDKPVRYLVYTHWHFDHNNGASAYVEAFPDITIVSERATRDFIDINSTWWARRSVRADQPKRMALAELEQQLASGKDGEGPLSREDRERLIRNIEQRRNELAELGSLKVVLPTLLFERELTLQLGQRRIELRDWGRANSPHDVTVYVPDAQILFAGDVLVQAPVPYFFESWPAPWIEVLRNLESIPINAIVPGHGPTLTDHTYTKQVRLLLESTMSRVAAAAREGRSLEEIQAQLDLSDVRNQVAPWRGAQHDEDWKITTRALIERAWKAVRGQGG